MKKHVFITGILAFLLNACETSQKMVYDDIYVNSSDIRQEAQQEREATRLALEQAEARAKQREAEAALRQSQSMSPDEYTEEDVFAENYEDESITEQLSESQPSYSTGYNADDYYDYQYSARIRRFYSNYYYPSYYNDFYTNTYWYDPNPYYYGTSIYFGYNFWYPSWNWGIYYRPSWYYGYHDYHYHYPHHYGYYHYWDDYYPYYYNYNYYDKNTITHRDYRPRPRQGGSLLSENRSENRPRSRRPSLISEDENLSKGSSYSRLTRNNQNDFVSKYERSVNQDNSRPTRIGNTGATTTTRLNTRRPSVTRPSQENGTQRPTTGVTRSVRPRSTDLPATRSRVNSGSSAPSRNNRVEQNNVRQQVPQNNPSPRSSRTTSSEPKRYQPANPSSSRSSQEYSSPSSRSSNSSGSSSSSYSRTSSSRSSSSGSSSSRSSSRSSSSSGSSRTRR